MALTLLIIAQTSKGRQLFEKRKPSNSIPQSEGSNDNIDQNEALDEDTEQESIDSIDSENTLGNFIQVFEILLAFHAWYKSEKSIRWDKILSKDKLLRSIRILLKRVKDILPRCDGNGWKIQKFHELTHIAYDVENFGSPKNFDTGIMENRLIHVGKKIRKQRRNGEVKFLHANSEKEYINNNVFKKPNDALCLTLSLMTHQLNPIHLMYQI